MSFGRKQGRLIVSHGNISGISAAPGVQNFGFQDFLQDGEHKQKYSHVKVRWNGETLWLDPVNRIDINDHIQVLQNLDTLWKQVNSGNWTVPAGYDGWWQPEK